MTQREPGIRDAPTGRSLTCNPNVTEETRHPPHDCPRPLSSRLKCFLSHRKRRFQPLLGLGTFRGHHNAKVPCPTLTDRDDVGRGNVCSCQATRHGVRTRRVRGLPDLCAVLLLQHRRSCRSLQTIDPKSRAIHIACAITCRLGGVLSTHLRSSFAAVDALHRFSGVGTATDPAGNLLVIPSRIGWITDLGRRRTYKPCRTWSPACRAPILMRQHIRIHSADSTSALGEQQEWPSRKQPVSLTPSTSDGSRR